MKVLQVSTHDVSGGAARAAYRLHKGLQALGIPSEMLVAFKTGDDPSVFRMQSRLKRAIVRLASFAHVLPLHLYKDRDGAKWSVNWIPTGLAGQIAHCKPDIVHFHWIGSGFVPWGTLRHLQMPIVWTQHDMWAFTGGCHYDEGCGRYRETCGACPQLASTHEFDLSRWIWQLKRRAWQRVELNLVAPSQWLAGCIAQSSLFGDRGASVIPYGLDTDRFKPHPRELARDLLSLPQERQLILFGALRSTSEPRKGFVYLQQALQRLGSGGGANGAELVIFGASRPLDAPDFGLPVHYVGSLHDDLTLALLYSAADLFVAPSAQDNLPNTILEALACGTPCVAFRIGGMPDMIDHERNGYLAQPFEADDLARGMAWTLENQERWHQLSTQARAKAEREFTSATQAHAYLRLYTDLLTPASSQGRNRPTQPPPTDREDSHASHAA